MLAVRGRRQVGKSRLLTRFVEQSDLPSLYTTAAKGAAAEAHLGSLARDALRADRPLPSADVLFAVPPTTWEEAFQRLALATREGPSIVVLDELPWAADADPALEGILQVAWDRHLEATPVLLVLVGSDLAVMERLTTHDRPLFGRARELVVPPLDPADCRVALGARGSATRAIDAHLVTGGYPRLVVGAATGAADPVSWAADQLQDEHSDLVAMAGRSLDAEFPSVAQARRVLGAIGADEVGWPSFGQIVGGLRGDETSTTPSTATVRALHTLVEAKGVVAVDRPVGSNDRTRLRRYRIADPYLRFWFRFVEPAIADIARGRADLAIGDLHRDWTTFRGRAVEPLVREAVFRLAPDLPGTEAAREVGGWWNRQHNPEIDLVVAGSDRRDILAVGTVKWRDRKAVSRREVAALAEHRAALGASEARLVVVCPAGLAPDVDADLVLGPDDLLAAWERPTPTATG